MDMALHKIIQSLIEELDIEARVPNSFSYIPDIIGCLKSTQSSKPGSEEFKNSFRGIGRMATESLDFCKTDLGRRVLALADELCGKYL